MKENRKKGLSRLLGKPLWGLLLMAVLLTGIVGVAMPSYAEEDTVIYEGTLILNDKSRVLESDLIPVDINKPVEVYVVLDKAYYGLQIWLKDSNQMLAEYSIMSTDKGFVGNPYLWHYDTYGVADLQMEYKDKSEKELSGTVRMMYTIDQQSELFKMVLERSDMSYEKFAEAISTPTETASWVAGVDDWDTYNLDSYTYSKTFETNHMSNYYEGFFTFTGPYNYDTAMIPYNLDANGKFDEEVRIITGLKGNDDVFIEGIMTDKGVFIRNMENSEYYKYEGDQNFTFGEPFEMSGEFIEVDGKAYVDVTIHSESYNDGLQLRFSDYYDYYYGYDDDYDDYYDDYYDYDPYESVMMFEGMMDASDDAVQSDNDMIPMDINQQIPVVVSMESNYIDELNVQIWLKDNTQKLASYTMTVDYDSFDEENMTVSVTGNPVNYDYDVEGVDDATFVISESEEGKILIEGELRLPYSYEGASGIFKIKLEDTEIEPAVFFEKTVKITGPSTFWQTEDESILLGLHPFLDLKDSRTIDHYYDGLIAVGASDTLESYILPYNYENGAMVIDEVEFIVDDVVNGFRTSQGIFLYNFESNYYYKYEGEDEFVYGDKILGGTCQLVDNVGDASLTLKVDMPSDSKIFEEDTMVFKRY